MIWNRTEQKEGTQRPMHMEQSDRSSDGQSKKNPLWMRNESIKESFANSKPVRSNIQTGKITSTHDDQSEKHLHTTESIRIFLEVIPKETYLANGNRTWTKPGLYQWNKNLKATMTSIVNESLSGARKERRPESPVEHSIWHFKDLLQTFKMHPQPLSDYSLQY